MSARNSEALATTKLSSKGQVVIPEQIRLAMGLEAGVQFIVVHQGDAIMLKLIAQPSVRKMKALQRRVKAQARKAGLKAEDLKAAIREVRTAK